MKVWKVSTGSYSYYSVVAVFASKKLAKQYVEAKGGDYRVEKGDRVIAALPDNPTPQLHLHSCVKEDGTVEDDEKVTYHFPGIDNPSDLGSDCYSYTESYGQQVNVRTRGTDLKKVRKVHSEARAQALADGPILLAKKRAEREEQERRYLASIPPHMRDSAIANMGTMILPRSS